jgi:hypothetical protein
MYRFTVVYIRNIMPDDMGIPSSGTPVPSGPGPCEVAPGMVLRKAVPTGRRRKDCKWRIARTAGKSYLGTGVTVLTAVRTSGTQRHRKRGL